jgi:type IV pilus assembly protein PilC
VYSASLLAGERSGNLDSVIRRYVAYEKLIGAARRRTISALIYPVILMTMMVVLIRHHRPEGDSRVFGLLLDV